MHSTANSIEKTTRTMREITNSQRKAFEAVTENFANAGRRGVGVSRGFTNFLRLQESNARVMQDIFTAGMRFAELQQRNARFLQDWTNTGVGYLRDQAEGNARTAEVVAQSAREQQEGFRALAEEWAGVYEDFFSSWMSYSQKGLENAQRVTERVAEGGMRAAEQGLENAERSARQGLRVAEDAAEQTERAARRADPNDLPIDNYDELNVGEISERLEGLSAAQLRKVHAYEKRNHNRQTLVGRIERKIKDAS